VKVTKGIISSLTGIGNNLAEMQIDAALQSGNSGGPILDEYGNVVGVAVAKLDVKFALENFGAIPENTNFGVKANIVEALLDANGVNYQQGKAEKPSGAEFSNILSNGTYYISCWMTLAQIEAMKTKKVMFSDLQ
jgi:S1-C subfamily serine protease